MRTVLVLLLLATSAPAFADGAPKQSKPITQGNDPRDGMISTKIHSGERPATQPLSKDSAKPEHSHGIG